VIPRGEAADVQRRRDLGIRQSLGEHARHSRLLRRQAESLGQRLVGVGRGGFRGDCHRDGTRGRPPEQRLDASEKLEREERLDHVVVRACVQSLHPILRRSAPGQDEHRTLHAVGADPFEHGHAVHARQTEVEDHEVGCALGDRVQRVQPVARHLRAVAVTTEIQRDGFGEIVLVLDDEDEWLVRRGRHSVDGRSGLHAVHEHVQAVRGVHRREGHLDRLAIDPPHAGNGLERL
jgi:hypothetical protein